MSATDWNGLDGHEALVSELRANPPVAPERLRQRVLELGPASRSRRAALPRSRRGRALAVVLVAAAIAVGAALVHGFVSSGSHSAANEALYGVVARPDTIAHTGLTHGSGSTSTVVQAGTARVLKPNAFGAYKGAAGNSGQALNLDNLPAAELLTIPKDRLVHADASLQVHVGGHSALTSATNKATQIVSSLGGYAQSVQYQSETKGGGSSFLALKVPVGKAQTAIGRLAQLGTLVSQQVSTQDLQQTLTRQTNGIGTLRRAIAVYEQALKTPLTASQRIEIQIKLANARHSVKVLRKARAGTVASGAAADISLTLTTSKSSIVGGGSHTSGRFDRLLGGAAGFLALEGIIVLYALVVLSPLLVIGGLAWVFLRERRRRDERRLLAST
jgi:Domain of unknown function (DUF4349)